MRQVGQAQHQLTLLGIGGFGFLADFVDASPNAAHLGLDGAGVLAFLLGDADVFAGAVAIVLQRLLFGLGAAALLVDGEDFIHGRRVVRAALVEALLHGVGAVADDFDVEHKGAQNSGGCGFAKNKKGTS